MSLLFALLAAFSTALNVVTQHVASTAAPATEKGRRLALYLIRSPLWLLGVGAMVAHTMPEAAAYRAARRTGEPRAARIVNRATRAPIVIRTGNQALVVAEGWPP